MKSRFNYSQYFSSLFQDESNGGLPLYVYICMSVGGTLFVVIVLFIIGLCIRTKTKKTKDLMAVKENGIPDKLNNQETLLIDLLSTKNKGVQNLKDLNIETNHFFPILPEVQISARSSLRSFFMDNVENKEMDQQSEVISSIQDSGIHIQGQIQESKYDAYSKPNFARKSVMAVIETSV